MTQKNSLKYFFSENFEKPIYSDSLEHAYLLLLNENYLLAEEIFKQNNSSRAGWGVVLSQILQDDLKVFPSFFQISNFLEIDIDLFIKNDKTAILMKKMEKYLEILDIINCFIHQYICRVFCSIGYYKESYFYLRKSLDYFYKDLEVHFLLAKYFQIYNDICNAKSSLNECLLINNGYYPAIKLLKEFEEMNI